MTSSDDNLTVILVAIAVALVLGFVAALTGFGYAIDAPGRGFGGMGP